MERGVGLGHTQLQFFASNSSPLGLENTLHLIKYPFLGFKKPQFGAKLVVKIPRLGTRGQGKKCLNARTPQPPHLSTAKYMTNIHNIFKLTKKSFKRDTSFL